MMKGSFVSAIILSIFSLSAMGKTLELRKNHNSILIEEKTNWTLGKDLFGMPFIYFSPQTNGQRSNISFTDTGAEVELDITSLSENQVKYQEGKKSWAMQVEAKPLGFIPYATLTNKYGHKVHKIGFLYEHEGDSYQETSYYVECRGKLLFSKSLRLKSNEQHEKDFQDLIMTLDCGGV